MTPSSPAVVEVDRPAPGVGLVTLTRPERLNALNMEVKRRLEAAIAELDADPAVTALILTGGKDVFVAGTDVAEMRDMTRADHGRLGTNNLFLAVRACRKPIIAAVEGYALGGGCELALACDLVVAGEGARFGQPEIRVGIMPGAGGTQLLLRTIGRYRAMKLALTGEQVSASEAQAMGMVSEVVAAGAALERALELAKTIGRMPPLAVLAVKDAIRFGQEHGLSESLAHERALFEALFETEDQKEGMQAFLDKRRPEYQGA